MATPQGVMQTFLRMLMKNNTSSSKEALDSAVCESSNGKYRTMDAALEAFISEVSAHKNSTKRDQRKFLAERCGIIMDNEDTGALIGADASGRAVKTKDSIVDEGGSTYIAPYPTRSTVIRGITFNWPDSSSLTNQHQRDILARMNTVWLNKAMELVEKSYGVSFTECGVKTVTVNLKNEDNNWLAKASYSYYNNGKTNALSVTVNLKYFDTVDLSNESGQPANGQTYLDRTLAHELTHTFMQATIPYVAKLPDFVMEGMAELTHGIDDERYSSIYNVFNQSSTWLHDLLNVNGRYSSIPGEGYAAGYMFFRYLMKQSATSGVPAIGEFMPHKFVYTDNKTTLKVMADSQDNDDIDLSEFAGTVKTLDLSEDTVYRKIIRGTDRSERFYLSQKSRDIYVGGGNDTIYCKANSNDFLHFDDNDGNNVVYNYEASGYYDRIVIDNAALTSYGYFGDDRILRIGNTKVTLKNNAGTGLRYQYGNGEEQYLYAINDASNRNYISYSNDGNTLYAANGFFGYVDLNESQYSSKNLITVDASKVTTDFVVEGNYKNNTIKLGLGYNTVRYGVGSGRDVIYNFNPNKSELEITNGTLQKVGTAGNDVYLRYSNGEDVIQLVGLVNKSFNLDGQRTMVMAQDKANTVTYAAGVTYYGSKTKQDTLKVMNGERIHLYDANFHDIDVLNAQSSNKRVAMAGSNGTSILYGSDYDDDLAGSNGNTTFYGGGSADRIWCGAGVDTIMFSVGSNGDEVNDFDVNKDRIQSVNATLQKVGTSGNDVYLRYSAGNDVLQIKGIVNKSFLLDGQRTMVMAQDKANTVTYADGVTYYGSKTKQDTLKVMNGERVHLYDANIHDVDVLDGSQSGTAVKLGGGTGSGTVYGSRYADDLAGTATGTTYIRGNKGNDRIWASSGSEIIYFGTGDGQDTVYGGSSKDKLVLYDINDVSRLQMSRSGSNVTVGIKGTSDKVVLADWNNNRLRSIELGNGAQYQLQDNLSLSKTGISYMGQVQALARPAKMSVTAAQTDKLSELAMEIKTVAAVSGMDKKQMGM